MAEEETKDLKDPEKLTNMERAAVFLLSVDTETAGICLGAMDSTTVKLVTGNIVTVEEQEIYMEVREAVLRYFYEEMIARQYIEEGGLEYARILLEEALSPERASAILKELQSTITETPFQFLARTEGDTLLTFIQDEHPQTISLILSHLKAEKASQVLSGLSPKKQVDVVQRVAKMEQTSPEAVADVENGLRRRLAVLLDQEMEKTGGVPSVAEMLNKVDRATEKAIMENLEEDDPDLVEQIRKLMLVFEDLIKVNDKGVQALLKEVDNDELALAMKTATDELKNKVFANMSERAGQGIMEEMEFMGPVRIADVEAAQQRIVDIIRRLEESGDLIIEGRGGEEDALV